MKRVLVWDLPVRLFHWLLAAAFIGAFTIANTADDEGGVFAVHMLLGLIVAFMVVLRVVWGFLGTRYARFGSFLFGPRAVLRHLAGTAKGGGERHIGHNPGSSWAIYLMLGLGVGMAGTGLSMSSGSEAFEEVHEVLAWVFLGAVVTHLVGVAWHVWQHRENIVRSMVDGHKEAEPNQGITSARPLAAVAFLGLTGLWAGNLFATYDAATGSVDLPLLGQVRLGEAEESESDHQGGADAEEQEHEDDD